MHWEPENNHLEYKKSTSKIPSEIWESISAFANTDGGTIYLGIEEKRYADKPSDFVVLGVNNPLKLKNDLLDQLKNKNKISFPIVSEDDINIVNEDGKQIIKIQVPRASFSNRPIFIKNDPKNTFIREGERDSRASEADLKAIIRDSSSTDNYDLLDNFTIEDDLNILDIQNFKIMYFSKNPLNYPEEISNSDFLKNIGLFRKNRSTGEYQLSKAALLLFGKYNAITDIYNSFFLDFIVKDYFHDTSYIDRIYTDSTPGHPENIFSFFNMVSSKIATLVQNSFKVNNDLTREDSGEKLLRSLREALVNSLVHADYRSKLPTKITFQKDKVEFSNPGSLLVSKESFFSPSDSKTRNDLIFQTFVKAKLGEHTGSGGNTIMQTSIDLELEEPEIESSPSQTKLIIWKESENDFINKLPAEWQPTYDRISKRMIVSYSDLQDLYKNKYQGMKIIQSMLEYGLIEKRGERKGTKYFISKTSPRLKKNVNKLIEGIKNNLLN